MDPLCVNRCHTELSFPPQHPQRNFSIVTTNGEIEAGISKTKLTQYNLIKEWRKSRIYQTDFVTRGIEAEPK